MDKNKNRTDLLAAGRKRLQQFRQKKDNKGSTSQGESSKKSGKSKRRESDDSDVGSAVDNPKKISQASEESFSEHVSHPIEDSYSLESNVANPLPDMYEVRNIESSLENLKSHEDNVASLTPTIEENLSTADVEVVEVASSEDPKFTVSEGDMMLTDVPDASIPPISTDATEKGVGNSEIDSMIKKENLWHLSEDLSDVSSVAARAVQVADEADGLGSKQVNNNDEKEHDGDSRLSSEQGESAEIIDSLTLKGHGLDETTTETKQLGEQDNLSSGVVSSLDGIPPSSSQSDTYGKDAVTFEATKEQKDDSAVGSSTEETSDMLSESGDCIRSKDLVISENAVVAELHNMEDVPHSSTDPENKTNDKSQNSNMTTHIGFSEPGSSRLDHNSVSFSKLSELILGLGDDEYRFLISLRNSKFPTAENNISTEYGHFDALERLKEELVFSNSMKRISDMQFTEQSDELEKAFDHQRLELIDEISLLNTSLHEVREENGYLSKELMQNKSELEAVSSGRDDLQYQLNSARAEIEELSGRVHDLQAVLEKYQEDLSAMSTELVDCKNIVATLQSENETANRTLLSVIDERENLEKEKEDWLQENENLSTKLAESEKMVALMQLDLSNINDLLVSERNGRKAVEEEKENLAREIEKALTELAEHKGIVTDLRMENDSLVGIVSIVTEEKRKLEEEVEQIVHENDRLSSELLILQDQLSKVIGERMEFEINLENSMMCLEQLIEQTILLNISLDAHKAELREIDSWQSQMPPQGSVAVSQVGYVGMQKGVHEVAIEDHISNKISSLDEPLSDKLKKSPKPELHEQKLFNDSGQFVVLEGHLQEAEEILQKLDKEVDSMRAQLASENRQGGKAASSGVSKLIQAFESNVTADEDEQRAQSEDTLPNDPCAFIKEQIGRLTSVLKQLMMDAENAGILFRGELEAKKTVADAARELSSRYEDLQEHGCTLEATNVELGVLYEAMKHHLFDVEHKNNELLVSCENLKCQDISQKAENSRLVVQLDVSQLKISDLEVKLHELQQISEEKNSLISRQLEVSRKEAADHALQLEKEWSSTISQLDGTIQKFDKSIGGLFPLAVTFTSSDPNDVVGRVTASIHVAFKVIEDMLEKLQAAHVVEVVLRHSYEELAARFNILHVKNAANVIVLQRLHGELKALVNDSSGSAEDGEMEMQNDQLLDPADLYYFETLMNQLKSSLDEKLQLFSVNDHLRSEVKELTDKSFDVNALHDLVEDVVAVIKPEGTVFESDDPPIVRLKSLMNLLVHNYTEADEKLKRECESEFLELTKMQEKIEDFSTMQIQQESEILVLKESLRQAEESLAASCSELREKSTELEQSEQRVSSLREKLSIAVAKGKGLVVQRDSLKQSLAETSSELESCSGELKLKAARLSDVEEKLKAYSEAGERVEALESELSYIRNSATALRESFLLKDSVIQRIEEILEELDLPENFHSRGILEKIDWLARSAMGNSVPLADWDQKGSVEGGSYSDAGFTASDAWREDGQPGSNSGDDFRRRFEDVQGKFYGLAEQNEMLEQSLMERNNLVQRWEELLDRINMPPQLRSMDPVDRIEWLGAALSEAYHGRTTLQEKIDKLESYCELMTSDLDESKRQRADLEAELKEIGQGREKLKERLTILIGDREKLSAMVVHLEVEKVTLEDEVNDLQDRLAEKIDVEKNMLVVKHDIRRFQDMVVDALHDPGLKSTTYNNGSTEGLEERLTKLIESYKALLSAQPASSDEVDRKLSERDVTTFHTVETKDALDSEELDIVGLKKELEEALRELKDVKEERDSYLEKQQSLISEVEAMNSKITELQALLGQEEQKSASVREKLNVAVRKGKSLVQQRDGLKQTIEDLNNEVERLKSDLNSHVNAIADYEQKMKILSSYQDRLEAVEAENSFLRNHLAEAEQYLQEKDNRLNTLLQTLDNIDTGKEIDLIDPVKKLEQMGTLCHELHTSLAHSEQEVMKSKRAADLLLAELNEVQERNDGLQEDLDKAANELEVLSRGRNEAEASKLEALSRLEKLSTAHIEERKNLFAQIMQFKSDIEQLNNGLYDIHNQLPYFFSKNLEFMRNMKVRLESFYEPSLITGVFNLPIIGSLEGFSSEKENFQSVDSWSISHEQDIYDDNFMVEMCSYVARHIKDIVSDVVSLKENLRTFSLSLREHANSMSETMSVVQSKVNSQRESFEAMKKSITHLESNLKEKDSEVDILQRNMSLLYEACASSISEIENRKAAILGNNVDAQDVGVATNVESSAGLDFSRHTNMMPVVENMAGRFRNVVKEFACMNAKTLEGGQKDMKTTIANLQKELQEKDIQKDRICIELVGQIKEVEAAAHRHLVDLQSSESHLSELQEHLRVMEVERNVLKQNVNELQDEQASSKELQEKVELLTEAVNAKDQEIESLMQALDEEEAQMEDLKSKVQYLEKVLQQKDLDLDNLESSCAKVMKKLSVTVARFDELHQLSGNLLTEVENLQSQLQEKDAEISFLRQEVTRCTNDVLIASQMSSKSSTDEIQEFLTWLDNRISGVMEHDVQADDVQSHELKERLKKKIMSILSELVDLRVVIQSKDALLQVKRSRVEELTCKKEMLEKSLHENESQLGLLDDAGDSGPTISATSQIVEAESVINKWTVPATSSARQVRSLRKANNEQVAIAIDTDADSSNQLADEDDEKVHGFKSLTRSRIVPRFTRPITDMVDGLWVSCDRALMRHPTLRLGIIIYWAILHALLGTFVV